MNNVLYTQQLNAVEISLLPEGFRHPSNKERGKLHNESSRSTWLEELYHGVLFLYPRFKSGYGSLNFRIYENRLIILPAHQKCAIEIGFTKDFAAARKAAGEALLARLDSEENTIRNFTGAVLEEHRSYDYGKYDGVMKTWRTARFTLSCFKDGERLSKKVLESESITGKLPDTSELKKEFEEYQGNKIQTYYKYTGFPNNPPREWSINIPFILSHVRGNEVLTELLK